MMKIISIYALQTHKEMFQFTERLYIWFKCTDGYLRVLSHKNILFVFSGVGVRVRFPGACFHGPRCRNEKLNLLLNWSKLGI